MFIQLYRLAMVCSEQKRPDAYFNTSAADRRTKEEPEAKKYHPFNHKCDPAYIKLVFLSNDSCLPRPVCEICQMVLSNEAMKPSKIHRHLGQTKNAHLKDKSEELKE